MGVGAGSGAPEQAAGQDAKKYSSTNPVVAKLLERWTGVLRGVIGDIADDDVVVDVARASNVVFHVRNTGTVTLAAGTFVFEASVDSTNGTDGTWFPIQAVRSNSNTIETQVGLSGITAGNGYGAAWEASVNAYRWMRLRCSVNVTASAIAQWTILRGSYATEPIPASQVSGTQPVSGSVTANTATGSGYYVETTAAVLAAVVKSSAASFGGWFSGACCRLSFPDQSSGIRSTGWSSM